MKAMSLGSDRRAAGVLGLVRRRGSWVGGGPSRYQEPVVGQRTPCN